MTYQYAFDEIHQLLKKYKKEWDSKQYDTPTIRYICALFAELAYYQIPDFELDNQKRGSLFSFSFLKRRKAKRVPSTEYSRIFTKGIDTNIQEYMRSLDIQILFLIVDVNILVIGVKINRFLFITFRGTRFLFDWRINFQSNLKKLTFSKKIDYLWFLGHDVSLSVETYPMCQPTCRALFSSHLE
ncbi:hypothetical protein HMY34_17335 [Thiothrix subterranea]|uniref:hypothetical protein n=1 Tax=Thiothrix subterranea TaxID=2735563 RepID=UPI00192AF599|nr:hypothetical protein [Thiothrix subterranea]QQZ30376.1 hypothetical protein HMY34_17335 [Thiothrix subterranea]